MITKVLFPELSDVRVVALGLGALVFAVFLWVSPRSPLALDRADASLAAGDPLESAARYDAVARTSSWPGYRGAALQRGALVRAIELHQPAEARKRLELLLDQEPEPVARAVLLERLAGLLEVERQPLQAGRRYAESAELDPTPSRWSASARAYGTAGAFEQAAVSWLRLAEAYPERRADALLGRAELLLAAGKPTDALDLYQRAEALSDDDPAAAALARLGRATCLERLGDLDAAIASMDLVDLSDEARARRVEGMRVRLHDRGGALNL